MYLHSFSGPQVTEGRYGNAIYTPNTEGKVDDNVINLGTHENDCFGNVSLCTNGATLSLWIKVALPSHRWPRIIDGSWFAFWLRFKNNEILLSAQGKNGTHVHLIKYFAKVTNNQWHNIGITFSPGNGFEVYFDGCRTIPTQISDATLIPRSIQLGCQNGVNCAEISYDDLRFWTAKKSPYFMWWLWKM